MQGLLEVGFEGVRRSSAAQDGCAHGAHASSRARGRRGLACPCARMRYARITRTHAWNRTRLRDDVRLHVAVVVLARPHKAAVGLERLCVFVCGGGVVERVCDVGQARTASEV